MRILLLSSTSLETEFLQSKLKTVKKPDKNFGKYQYKDHNVDLLITGIGCASTTYMLMKSINTEKYDFIIQVGIAGSYTNKYKIGGVVNVISERFADQGVEDKDKFFTLFEKGITSPEKFPYTGGKLVNPLNFDKEIIKDIPSVSGITVNRVTGNRETISMYRKKFNPDVESMEGAPFFYICIMEEIPFIELRGISNFVEERNRKSWSVKSAVNSSNETLLEILDRIC